MKLPSYFNIVIYVFIKKTLSALGKGVNIYIFLTKLLLSLLLLSFFNVALVCCYLNFVLLTKFVL